MAMGADQYRDLVARETKRYGRGPVTGRGGVESARDAAVRAANISAGFGNSTALKMPQNAVGGGVKTADRGGPGKRGKGGGPGGPRTGSVKHNPMDIPTTPGGDYTFADMQNPRGMQTPTSATSFYPTISPTSVGGGPQPHNPIDAGPNNPWMQMNRPDPLASVGDGVPANSAMSQASVLQTLAPELLANRMTTPTSAHSRWGSLFAPPPPFTGQGPQGVGMPGLGIPGIGMPNPWMT